MKCNVCGNSKNFVVEGKEVRMVDTDHPQMLSSYFLVTKAVCTNRSCTDFPSTNVTLDPIHPNLEPFEEVL